MDEVNEAFQRWTAGEPNPLFDRLTSAADAIASGEMGFVDLTHLSDEEFLTIMTRTSANNMKKDN